MTVGQIIVEGAGLSIANLRNATIGDNGYWNGVGRRACFTRLRGIVACLVSPGGR